MISNVVSQGIAANCSPLGAAVNFFRPPPRIPVAANHSSLSIS